MIDVMVFETEIEELIFDIKETLPILSFKQKTKKLYRQPNEFWWHEQALCNSVPNKEVFFPEQGEEGKIAARVAKFICKGCPVKKECLEYALKYKVSGIWSSTTEKERIRIRKFMGIKPLPLYSFGGL